MSFRDRLKVFRSRAEDDLLAHLCRDGLNVGLSTNVPMEFTEAECREFGVKGTVIDFFWSLQNLATYLDGKQVHHGRRAMERDEAIRKVLELRGIHVLRFEYNAPLSLKRRFAIVADITDELRELRNFESNQVCEYGKKYPCCDCCEPCAEELKRRAFYESLPEPTEDEIEGTDPEEWEG